MILLVKIIKPEKKKKFNPHITYNGRIKQSKL